jgi:hypothetical protein
MILRGLLIQFFVCATLAIATPALAQTYEDGLVAFDKGDFATAATFWQPLADAGNAKAQHGLGMLYEAGLGVPAQDYAKAASYYRMAAAQGEIASANNLALMYAAGRGVPQDFGIAAQLWTQAAEAGNPMAQFNLGLLYFRGSGMEAPNYNEAAWWFGKAAEGGSVDGQFAMGELFAQGLGVPQNFAEAERWYKLAAGGGQRAAQQRLIEIQSGTFPPTTGNEVPGPEGMILPAVAPETVVAEDASETTEIVDEATGDEIVVETDEEEIVAVEDAEPVEVIAATEEVVEVEEAPTRESVELPSNAPIAAAPTVVTYAPGPSAGETGNMQSTAATVAQVASVPTADVATDPAADVPIVAWPETAPAAAPTTPVEVVEVPEPAATVASAPIVNTVTAPVPEEASDSGIYLLLGQSISIDDGERAWSELQRDHPAQLGALSSKLVPRGDGSLLILGGPLPSPDAGNRICMSLAQRDVSVECYVINN